MESLKYLNWKWYDWVLLPIAILWITMVTMLLSPLIVAEYVIFMTGRLIRENRYYERHDFGEIIDYAELDEQDRIAREEIMEEHVIGHFIYKSRMAKIWCILVTFGLGSGELR